MKHICHLVLIAALITVPVLCQARPNELGVGTLSCEVWTKDRADTTSESHFVNGAWIQGYLTAVNVFGDGPSHIAKGTDADGIMAWIDNRGSTIMTAGPKCLNVRSWHQADKVHNTRKVASDPKRTFSTGKLPRS